MKKIMLFISLLSSYSLLAETEAILKTGLEINPEFAPVYENKDKNIYGKDISHNKTGYNLKLLDLNIDIKDKGLSLGTQIKSQRNNITLNDWDGDTTDTSYDKETRVKNHDLGIKLNAKYISPEFFGLKSTTELKYYVDNLVNNRKIDKNTNIVTDLETPAEFIEDDGSKERLGNTIIKSALNGKFLNKVNVNADVEYKANQLVRFDKDTSHLKTNLRLSGNPTEDVKVEGKYSLNYDLNFANTKFDPLTAKLDEFPDYLGGNYVDLIRQEVGSKITTKFGETDNFVTIIKTGIDTFVQGGENKNEPIRSIYNKFSPILAFSFEKKLGNNIVLKPEFNNKIDFRHTVFYPQTEKQILQYDTWFGYNPEFNLGFTYGNDNINYSGKVGYEPSITVYPFVTLMDDIKHTYKVQNLLEGKYIFNENTNINGSFEANVDLPIMHGAIQPINTKLYANLNLVHKFNESLDLNTNINNKLDLISDKQVLDLNKFTEELGIDTTVNYKVFENKNDKLNLISKLGLESKTQFNYFVKGDIKKSNDKQVDNHPAKKIVYLEGRAIPLESLNVIKFDNTLNYENVLSENLKLFGGLDVNAKLEFLALRDQRLHNYKNREQDRPINKVNLVVSDYRKVNWNVGGNITINPNIKVEYKPTNKLTLIGGLNTKVVFEREIVNKINSFKGRADHGTYGWADKDFGFKKFIPGFSFNLEYKW